MKRWFINSFEKKEKKDKEKYDKLEFLERYLKRYRSYTSTMNWLLPIVLFITLLNAIIQFSQYFSFDKTNNLIVGIIWTVAVVLWAILTIAHFTFYGDYIKKRVDQWDEEYQNLKENIE